MRAAVVFRTVLASAVVSLGLALVPTPAWAHATLVGSTPKQDDRLTALPAEVVFEFSEDMSAPAYVVVTAPDGSSMTVGGPVVDGHDVRQAVTTDGPAGAYTMAFRVVSADGHPITGQVTFSVGQSQASPTSPTTQSEDGAQSPSPAASGDPSSDRSTADARSEPGQGHRDVVALFVGGGLFLLAGGLWLASRKVRP